MILLTERFSRPDSTVARTGFTTPMERLRLTRSDTIDIAALWAALKSKRGWIFLPTVIAVGFTAVAVNLVSPLYTATTQLLLENRESTLTRTERGERDPVTGQIDQEGVMSQIQVVKSNELSRQAIRQLDLIGNPEFDPVATPLGMVGRLIVLLGFSKVGGDRPADDRMLNRYNERLEVTRVGRSRVLAVEFTSRDPEMAAKGANVIADLYLEALKNAKKETARAAGNWLLGTIEPLRKRVTDAEAKVEAFRSRSGLLVSTNNATLAQQQLAEISTQLSAARAAKGDAEAKGKLIREMIRAGRTFEISDVVNNELIRKLIEQRGTLKAQLALESRTLLPAHPQIKALNAQLADVETQIRTAAERQVRAIANDARVAGSRVEALTAALDGEKKIVGEANENEVQLRALEREARALREQLESYLAKHREAIARDAENSAPPDARVFSRAVVPANPSFPRKIPFILLAGLATFSIAACLVMSRELVAGGLPVTHATIVASDEPDEAKPRPTAHAGPPTGPVQLATPGIVEQPSPAAPVLDPPQERLAGLAASIAASRTADGVLRLLVVAHGRDTCGLAPGLARALARRGRAMLLSVADHTLGEAGPGLAELVRGRVSFSEAIRRDGASRLHRIGSGAAPASTLARETAGLRLVLDALSQTYDLLVIDMPAETEPELARMLAQNVDCVVLVGRGPDPDHSVATSFELFKRHLGKAPQVLLLGMPAEPPSSPAA